MFYFYIFGLLINFVIQINNAMRVETIQIIWYVKMFPILHYLIIFGYNCNKEN